MDEQILQKLKDMEAKLDAVYESSERTRKYMLTMLIVSVLVIVLPLIGFIFVIPQFLDVYSDLGGLGL